MSEVRETDPDTGGQKGVKMERFDLLPVRPLEDIARVFGFGASKYAERNWEKGYKWSRTYGALQRHLNAFWRGEDNDSESGLSHLSHAGFHVLALLEFMRTHKEKDDRSKDVLPQKGSIGCGLSWFADAIEHMAQPEALSPSNSTQFTPLLSWDGGQSTVTHQGLRPSGGPVLSNDLLGGPGNQRSNP